MPTTPPTMQPTTPPSRAVIGDGWYVFYDGHLEHVRIVKDHGVGLSVETLLDNGEVCYARHDRLHTSEVDALAQARTLSLAQATEERARHTDLVRQVMEMQQRLDTVEHEYLAALDRARSYAERLRRLGAHVSEE